MSPVRAVTRLFLGLLTILLLPSAVFALGLQVVRLDNPNAIECPYCHRPIVAGQIHENASETLATQFGGSLAERGIAYSTDPMETRRLQVFVYRFQERRGGDFSVERPASVGFHVHLYQGTMRTHVFVFDETQQPLSDNVLRLGTFIKRGAKWVTASDLAREGVHSALEALAAALQEEGPGGGVPQK